MEPRTVPAGQGVAWLREGLDLFAAAPLTWLGITLLFSGMLVFSVVPFAGMFASVAIPMFIGGLMLGCDAQRRGQPLEVRYLFSGFEAPRLQPLAIVGALYLAASVVVMLPVIAVVVGTSLAGTFAAVSAGSGGSGSAGVGIAAVVAVTIGLLILMAATVLLSMAIWFAPSLVVFRGVAPVDAMKLSLRGALRNLGPFAVYVLAVMGIGLLVMLPLLGAILLAAARGGSGGDLSPMLAIAMGGTGLFALICIVLLMPPMWGAMYASYRDVFAD
jgi:hypothetical protein